MFPLFADETAVEAADTFFPPYFGKMMAALALVFLAASILFAIGYRIVDFITPGNLGRELLGAPGEPGNLGVPPVPAKAPNIALAIVAAAMIIGLSGVLGATVIGVLVH